MNIQITLSLMVENTDVSELEIIESESPRNGFSSRMTKNKSSPLIDPAPSISNTQVRLRVVVSIISFPVVRHELKSK